MLQAPQIGQLEEDYLRDIGGVRTFLFTNNLTPSGLAHSIYGKNTP